jgi:hypothetical protein
MAQPLVQVEGARELRTTLRKAGVDLEDMKDANAAVAAQVAAAASARAPHKSGALASSVRGNRAAGAAVIKIGRASVPYAGVIHWGWPARNIRPQPFAVDAAHDTEPAWTETYFRAIEQILSNVRGA